MVAFVPVALMLLVLSMVPTVGSAAVSGSGGPAGMNFAQSSGLTPSTTQNGSSLSTTAAYPMGLADYGKNGASQYGYNTSEIVSWANFTALTIGKANIGVSHQMTIQQNAVAYSVRTGAHYGQYWVQDVPYITQSKTKYTVQMLDNIWNFSSSTASMSGSAVTGNLEGNCAQGGTVAKSGSIYFYYCVGNLVTKTSLPFEVKMTTVVGVLSSGPYSGDSDVEFIIGVYHSGTLVGSQVFDEVAFHSGGASNPKLVVGGTNPFGLPNDIETVICGPGGGSSVAITAIGAKLSESYLSGASLVHVPHAYSYGYDTAETAKGVRMSSSVAGLGTAAAGTDNKIQLW